MLVTVLVLQAHADSTHLCRRNLLESFYATQGRLLLIGAS